ncbi:MAG: anti-sigma factor antagonist [Anaerolineae bacterium]|nr:anti-sigma factor antagonist [Anaerolineae bacterium]MDW8298168.1 anti-sigma factor antagonist [Anaerolineae bacterium]
MPHERRFIMQGELAHVPEACQFVRESARLFGLSEKQADDCELATEEWCTNIIEHGYNKHGIQGRIEIVCQALPSVFRITIYDDSPPFDPTTLPVPDRNAPLKDRQPGGLGWFFIQELMDTVQYEYRNGRNTLIMTQHNPNVGDLPQTETQSAFPARTLTSGVRVVTPSGRIDSTTGRQFEAALNAQLEAGFNRIVVEMQAVTYISSTGLKVLLGAQRRAQAHGGGIALASLTRRVREVFEMSGFDTIFTLANATDEAARALEQG